MISQRVQVSKSGGSKAHRDVVLSHLHCVGLVEAANGPLRGGVVAEEGKSFVAYDAGCLVQSTQSRQFMIGLKAATSSLARLGEAGRQSR